MAQLFSLGHLSRHEEISSHHFWSVDDSFGGDLDRRHVDRCDSAVVWWDSRRAHRRDWLYDIYLW